MYSGIDKSINIHDISTNIDILFTFCTYIYIYICVLKKNINYKQINKYLNIYNWKLMKRGEKLSNIEED